MRRIIVLVGAAAVTACVSSASRTGITDPPGGGTPPPQDSVPHASITGLWVGEDSAFNANGTGVYAPPCAGLPYLGYRLQAVQSGDTVTFTGTEFCDPHDTVGQYGPVTVVASHDTLFKKI